MAVYALLIASGETRIKDPFHVPAQLQGPQSDVALSALLLSGRYDVPTRNIAIVGLNPSSPAAKALSKIPNFVLREPGATKKAIENGFNWLLAKPLQKDDQVFLFYSGHGATVDDFYGDDLDDYDQAWVPLDFRLSDKRTLILDDEVGAWIDRLQRRGVVVTVVVDSCFAGGSAKSSSTTLKRSAAFLSEGTQDLVTLSPEGTKEIVLTVRGNIKEDPQSKKRTYLDMRRANCNILAACLSNQGAESLKWEYEKRPHEKIAFGPFTLALCRILWRNSRIQRSGLEESVRRELEAFGVKSQTPVVVMPQESFLLHPQSEGIKGIYSLTGTLVMAGFKGSPRLGKPHRPLDPALDWFISGV